MNRPSFTAWLIAISLAFPIAFGVAHASLTASEAETGKPNIVVILVDDMGYGDPGCFNPKSKISTPHIDSLARDGMRFTDAHASGPLCHVSRYGLITGRYPFRAKVGSWRTRPVIEKDQTTIASLAKSSGYRTAMVGKWHLGFDEGNAGKPSYDRPLPGGPVDCGFDSYFGIRASTDIPPYFYIRGDRAVEPPSLRIEANRSEGWSPIQGAFWRAGGIAPNLELDDVLPHFTNEAIQVIEKHAEKKTAARPLMLYLAYPAPHTPWLPSESFAGKSAAGLYGDFLMMVDAEIGRVLASLRRAGMEKDTLLVFTSDNGPVWYENDTERFGHDSTGGLRGMKSDAWEAGHRMPFIVRWPGRVEAGSQSAQLVCFTDLLATFAEVFGVPLPAEAGPDSFSFLPALTGQKRKATAVRTQIAMRSGSASSMMTMRSGDWKLITGLGSGGFSKPKRIKPTADGPQGQLYNLAEDLGETKNLYASRPEIVARLTAELKKIVDEGRSDTRTARVDTSTLRGKVLVGYQGWFNCEGDGSGLGWKHWARRGRRAPGPGNVTVDLWPDVSELDPDERFATEFRNADGSAAEVFSSAHRKTVARHFRWMRDYGIDGAFLQRFATGLSRTARLENNNRVLANVREAAEQSGRAFAVMYDLSGLRAGQVKRVREDWLALEDDKKVTADAGYLHHEGRPLVAVWGIGFSDGRAYSLEECLELVEWLKSRGASVMLGVPSFWREGRRDATSDPLLHRILKEADIVSPWSVGRYQTPEQAARHADEVWKLDRAWCEREGLAFLPVAFPGFSWSNLKGAKLDQIPRRGGEFFWSQVTAARRIGCEMLYVAMFDEVDEGTAIFKCTNNPPVGEGAKFLGYEGLPSDHYLELTGQAGALLRAEHPRSDASALSPEPAKKSRPNVLFIVCDDLNTHVSTSGYPHIRTPAFDRLAAAGMTFRRAYCQYPVCGPSRASFLHGLYPESTGVLDNRSDIRDRRPGTVSMPQRFKEAGYWTGAVGKVFHNPASDPGDAAWHGMERFENDEMPFVTPIRQAFEAKHGTLAVAKTRRKWRQFYRTIAKQTRGQQPGYGPSGLSDRQHKDGKNAHQVAKWLLERAHGDKPFFLACGIQKPHVPFLAPDKYFEAYPFESLKFEPASIKFWSQAPKLAQTKRYRAFGFEFGVENDKLRREYVQAYHACISFIDAQIGIVFDALQRSGHWDDTIVVLTSDHGYMLGEKFLWGKVSLFESCDRVPLVIRVPGQKHAGSSSEGLVELVDIFPTLTELCDITAPPGLQGRSLVPMLDDPTAAGKEVAYTVVSRGDTLGRAIRTDRWRYAKWPVGEELYDLKADPHEETNLAISKAHDGTLASVRALLEKKRAEASSRIESP